MKSFLLILFSGLLSITASTQSIKGITGTPDTSYSIYSALAATLKTNPETRLPAELENSSFITKKNIEYCNISSRKLLLDAFYPKQKRKEKRIAVILIHGGGWRSGNRSLLYPMAQRLAALGYVCFTPEYRLSTEALYPAAIYDLKAAIRWVRAHTQQFNIDKSGIAVAGHSAGGELAAFLGTTNGEIEFEKNECNKNLSSHVNAIIDIDGILAFIHPESGEGDDSKRTSAATNWFGFSKTENPSLWQQASPLTHVDAATPPTLFINSEVERMHAGRDDFIKVLNRHHIFSEVKKIDKAPHSFCLFEPWIKPTVNYIDNFLKTVFKK